MKQVIVLASAIGLFCIGPAWANDGPEMIQDRALLGYWQFNDSTYKKDSSPWGNDIPSFPSGMSGVVSGTADYGYDGSGYLHISTAGATATVTMSDSTPTWNGTKSPYYTILCRFKSSKTYATSSKTTTDDHLNDTSKWHLFAARYQVGGSSKPTYSSYAYMFCCDPDNASSDFWNASGRPEDSSNSMATLPLSVSSGIVKIGGNVGSSSYKYAGEIDDAIVANRMFTKNEISRCFLTGETYVYATGNPSFSSASNWSSNEGSINFKPGDIPGQAYIIDSGRTMSAGATSEFGGNEFTGSLTLGRTEALMNRVATPNSQIVAASAGNVTFDVANTIVTIRDLRIRKGAITSSADGQSLISSALRISAPSSAPFTISVGTGTFTFDAGGQVTGSGVLSKTGAGKLVLNNFTAAAGQSPKLRLAEGSIKTLRLDGYTGGTVIVDGDAVTFTGADTLSGTIQVQYNGTIAAAEATYPVLNAPTLTSAGQVAINAAIPEKYEGAPKLENGVVSLVVTKKVAPIPDEDKGAKPVLLWQ